LLVIADISNLQLDLEALHVVVQLMIISGMLEPLKLVGSYE